MASVYRYLTNGGQKPQELERLDYLDRFGGAINVYGRPLGAHEIRHMELADNVRRAFYSRRAATNADGGWSKWAQDHPYYSNLLIYAEQLTEEGE